MKRKHCLNFIKLPIVAIALTAGTAIAGTETVAAPAPIAPAEDGCISAVLTLAANSHFISYGNDIWDDGSDLSDLGFNPSLEFSFDLPADFTFTLGTWWDVNDKNEVLVYDPTGALVANPSSPIGGHIQEIDLWAGLSYSIDKFTIGATYQAWIYGGTTEDIIDVKVAYDTFLSPSLTLHNRVSEGASGGDTGSILVAGLSHTFELGPVSISTPVNVAYAFDTGFHGPTSDNGYGYTSVGLNAAYPLEFLGDCYGEWSLISGLTYYWTDTTFTLDDQNRFLTYNFGLSASF